MYGRPYRKGMGKKMRLVPIDSTKNIVQFNTAVPTLTAQVVVLAFGVNPGQIDETDPTKTYYVEEGSMIRGFSISLRIFNESGVADSNSTVVMLTREDAGTAFAVTLAKMNSIGTQPFKNRVFHFEQAITGSQVSGWPMGFPSVKIPKRFHTIKNGDTWKLWVGNNTGNQLRMCGTVLYKWYK